MMKNSIIISLVLLSTLFVGCSLPSKADNTVNRPDFSITGGTYNAPVQVSITCSTTDSEIFYTTDGTVPSNSSNPYTNPLTISTTTTLKARAFKEGMNPSSTMADTYTITILPLVETPTFSPGGGVYVNHQTVTISCSTEGAHIYYTSNGSEPTTSSDLYNGSFTINQTTVLKAKAFKSGWTPSATATDTYTIAFPPTKPILIPHLGDTGDSPDSSYYNGNWVILTDDTNGIDAVPDIDGIRLRWGNLLDLDLNMIKIWRFDDFSAPRVIASISASQDYFTDAKNQTMNGDSLYYSYSYFIEVFNRAGLSTKSDTVSYRLLEKQIPHSPANGSILTTMTNLNFIFDRSGLNTKFRVLLFDEYHDLIWSTNLQDVAQNTYSIPYTGPVFTNKTMSWRVDAFEWDSILHMYAGSESYENNFTVQ
jgi:hypothetical protein